MLKALKRANRAAQIGGSSRITLATPVVQRDYHLQRDSDRASKWQSWTAAKLHSFTSVPLHHGATSNDVLTRAKYQFEPDSKDGDLENVIEGTIGELTVAVHNLRNVAVAVDGELMDRQNDMLRRTEWVADSLDDKLASNTGKLRRF
jgi:hypothetical protein